jgi:rare lipoprotein A
MRKAWQYLIITLFFLTTIGCAGKCALLKKPVPGSYTIKGKTYYPMKKVRNGYTQSGVASWYGPGFHGKKTASGEVYDMYALTAAHSILPLHTVVQVTNLKNKKGIIVRVNDRGPFVDDRVIDLSMGAANKLDIVKPGTAPVRVTVIGSAKPRVASKSSPSPIQKKVAPALNPFYSNKTKGLLARIFR